MSFAGRKSELLTAQRAQRKPGATRKLSHYKHKLLYECGKLKKIIKLFNVLLWENRCVCVWSRSPEKNKDTHRSSRFYLTTQEKNINVWLWVHLGIAPVSQSHHYSGHQRWKMLPELLAPCRQRQWEAGSGRKRKNSDTKLIFLWVSIINTLLN